MILESNNKGNWLLQVLIVTIALFPCLLDQMILENTSLFKTNLKKEEEKKGLDFNGTETTVLLLILYKETIQFFYKSR